MASQEGLSHSPPRNSYPASWRFLRESPDRQPSQGRVYSLVKSRTSFLRRLPAAHDTKWHGVGNNLRLLSCQEGGPNQIDKRNSLFHTEPKNVTADLEAAGRQRMRRREFLYGGVAGLAYGMASQPRRYAPHASLASRLVAVHTMVDMPEWCADLGKKWDAKAFVQACKEAPSRSSN